MSEAGMKQARHVIEALLAPWAILPEMYGQMLAIYDRWVRGEKLTPELRADIEAAIGKPLKNEEARYMVTPEGVAVIPVQGVISKRMGMFADISGGVSTQMVAADFREALGREDVKAILFDVDSPGGAVDGTQELALEIFQARGQKPMATFADGLMASAATWIGTAADEVYLSAETARAGSIGVVMVHSDESGRYEKYGIKNTVLSAGKYKAVGNRYEPLSKEARKIFQEDLDYIYSLFVEAVAGNRGATVERVLEDMAEGRMFSGSQAVKAGLVDGIGSRQEVINGLLGRVASTLTTGSATGRAQARTITTGVTAQKTGGKTVDRETLMAQHRDLYEAILAEGRALGVTEGKAAGIEEGKGIGATAERERIQAVLGQSMKGREELVSKLAFDGKTTAAEAALQVLAAEKADRDRVRTALETGAPDPAGASASAAEEHDKQASSEGLVGEAKWKHDWDHSAELQTEFQGKFERYKAYMEAAETRRARILSRKE
jgi:capsid assembly protease